MHGWYLEAQGTELLLITRLITPLMIPPTGSVQVTPVSGMSIN